MDKQLGKDGDVCLTLRQSNKTMNYWQLGYYVKGKWINIRHLGTPLKIYDFYCDKLDIEKEKINIKERKQRKLKNIVSDDASRTRGRKIMANHLKRPLRKGEVLHHLDSNPQNNSLENLHLFPNHRMHQQHHSYLKYTIRQELMRLGTLESDSPYHPFSHIKISKVKND